MKLIQVNIWGGRLETPLLRFISEQRPDFVCLQEVIDLKGGHALMFAALEEIKEASGLDNVFMSPVFTLNYMRRKASFGNAVISRFPFVEKETIFTRKAHHVDFDILDDDANVRNLQHVTVKLSNGELLHILNHHGHHIDQHKNGDKETLRQCGLIANTVKNLKGKVILTGDFNLNPHSESLEQINAVMTNLPVKHKLKTTRTPLTYKTEVCDYIFVSDEVEVKSFKASEEIVSDHQALIVEFE